jgi:hypothetical protein
MNKLPIEVERSLESFVEAAKSAFETDLVAVVLYGSAAADGALRATSDVNVLLVLRRFDQAAADRLREPMRVAHAAVQLNAMFLLDTEINAALEAFAVKFADILGRHRVLFGSDPFSHLATSRDALLKRLKQVLLNLQLRLRERYVLVSLREERLAQVIADAAPPLRASAASILELEGQGQPDAKSALEKIVAELQLPHVTNALHQMSVAREEARLAPGVGAPTLLALIELTQHLRERTDRVR